MKKTQILQKTLANVPFDGWSDAMLKSACRQLGLDENYYLLEFPSGAGDTLDEYLKSVDAKMKEAAEAFAGFQSLKIREKIHFLVKTRLEIMGESMPLARKTLGYLANPMHAGLSLKILWRTVDEMWYLAGDKSADFNYYTKRTLLAGVYTSTLLYWQNDKSEDFAATWEFLARRIENVMVINKVKAKFAASR